MENKGFGTLLSWFFQILAALILAYASYGKIVGSEMSTYIFDSLEMGEQGMFLVGILEAFASVLLVTPFVPHWGAILGFSLMLGALIAHLTSLGVSVAGDEGRMFFFLIVVLFSTAMVMFIRRRKLPLIGEVLY